MSPEEIRKTLSRREFFAGIVPVLSVPVIFWWLLTGKRTEVAASLPRTIEVAGDIPVGVSFHKDVVLVNDGKSKRAFRAKCTHLGCSIKKIEGDQLVCACHGSRFSLDGNVINGPAKDPLEELRLIPDPENRTLKIEAK
jgi:Rieske Fe-S protein